MKKSLSRILSVALVLAMVVSVVPFALATDSGPASVTINAPTSIRPGETLTVKAVVSGLPTDVSDVVYTWYGDAGASGNSDTATYEVPTDTEETEVSGSVVVTYSYQVEEPLVEGDPGFGEDGVPQTKTVTKRCEASDVYTVAINHETSVTSIVITGETNTVEVGETLPLTVIVQPENATNKAVTWASSDPEVATVDQSGVVTGVKKGTATITATAQDGSEVSGTFTVTVTDGFTVTCSGYSVELGATVTLKPSVTGAPKDAAVTYKFETDDTKLITLSELTNGLVTGRSVGIATVHVTASYTDADDVVHTAECAVSVSVYTEATSLAVTVKSGVTSFKFEDKNVFSQVKYGTQIMSNWVNESLYNLIEPPVEKGTITFTESTASGVTPVGYLSRTSATIAYLPNVVFTQNTGRTGDYVLGYTIYNEDNLIVSYGYLTITVGTASGDIVYETDYKTSVTFDEDDFENFWNKAYTASNNTLKYVTFDVSSSVPVYGELYTTSAKTKPVTSVMAFQPNYTTSSTYYDLDTVTYEPSSKYVTAYTVEIPFTAYGGVGTSAATKLSGTVVIELNTAANNITSRGVVFGSGTYSIVDQMAEDYKEAKNTELVYVNFYLPDVEDGRLYYDYDGILDSTKVTSKDSYFVDATTKQLDLNKVAFVPAAGTTGKITIYYTGYDKNATAYEGKITLNVVAKTKSDKFTDVTATSYSWAADSIDFLNEQGVVNGTSGTKFSPAASITRGDFMIMLYRAFLEEDYGDYNVTSNFADVPKGTTAYEKETYQAVGVAKYLGIAKGDGTNFKPKSSITREEAMTLIYRTLVEMNMTLDYSTTTKASSFSDYSSVSTYAQEAITNLVKHGIIVGSNNKINPKSNITRAEMAVILHRVLTY